MCISEISVILEWLLASLSIFSPHQVKGGHFYTGYDGDSSLNSTKKSQRSHPLNSPKPDLRKSIVRVKQRLYKYSELNLDWIYVKGHKDSEINWTSLSRHKQLNYICYTEAKRYLRFAHEQKINFPTLMPLEGWICTTRGTKITGNTHIPLLDHIGHKKASNFFREHNRIPKKDFKNTNWETVGGSML